MKIPVVLCAAAAVLACFVVGTRSASAYWISSLVNPGCHEKLTSEALRTVRSKLAAAAPLPPTADEQALVDDLEFTPADDMKDLGGVTLLLGVRDNDVKGLASTDLTELASVHGDPDTQEVHCLRNKAQDEPGGSEAALADCRAFIRQRVVEALEGLDAQGVPDPAKRSSLPVTLSLRGRIDARLPTYYVRMGQAIHTLQDSFSHTYRTADGMKITVVLNWLDDASGALDASRDGPAHASRMDYCDDPDELRTIRRVLATEASVALLRATLDSKKTPDEKMVTVEGVLDRYLSYAPGCTFDNAWCDAPETQYADSGTNALGCSVGGAGRSGGVFALLALAVIGLFARRRRAVTANAARLLLVGALALTAGSVRAAEPAAPDPHVPPPPTVVPVPEPGPRDPSEGTWGGYVGVAGSVDKLAFAGQLGLRRRLGTHWTIGLDVELNPWVSLYGSQRVRLGVFNTYGTIILRFPLAYENFNLRTTVNVGLSVLLIDLYGAPKGSFGPYGALYPLGLEWKLSRVFLLIINPLGLAIPVPQIRGVPVVHPQYRFSIGLGILAN